jgi:hypothetical protein
MSSEDDDDDRKPTASHIDLRQPKLPQHVKLRHRSAAVPCQILYRDEGEKVLEDQWLVPKRDNIHRRIAVMFDTKGWRRREFSVENFEDPRSLPM